MYAYLALVEQLGKFATPALLVYVLEDRQEEWVVGTVFGEHGDVSQQHEMLGDGHSQ